MAKLNVTVDNGLDEVKLESSKKLEKKNKNENKPKEVKVKKDKKNKKDSYLAQVGKEMKLVTWPTRKNIVKYSISTIVMIVLLALFFTLVSLIFDLLYGLVQGWLG